MYSCKESIELLLNFLEGDMPEEDGRQLHEHLRGCSPCIEFVQTYRATPGLCRKALAARMPEELAQKLTEFLRCKLPPKKP